MNNVARIGRSLTSLTGRAGAMLSYHAALPAAPAIARPGPPRRNEHLPLPAPARTAVAGEPHGGTRPHAAPGRLCTTILPARRPHAIQLCVHCRQRPAGFWVSRTGGKTVRRPWCLSCCQTLDRDHCDVTRFPS